MKGRRLFVLLVVSFVFVGCSSREDDTAVDNEFMRSDVQAVLIEGMGEYSRNISSDSESAQQFFDQGLNLVWGYYFPDAAASFLEALRHDSDNPMIYWGLAMASGPNPNSRYMGAPNDPKGAAKRAIEIAFELRGSASEQDQAVIEAVYVRYDDASYPDVAARDQAYLAAVRDLYGRYPQDPDVASMYADSFMVTLPWTYWDDDGNPAEGTLDVVNALEASMELHPMHPGTNHLYIHMLEASDEPERALPQADRLASIIPGGGHIVHMPTHIYVRVGQFDKAIDFNERSVEADIRYQEQWGSLPYPDFVTYPLSARLHPTHAFDFIRYSATIKGDYENALAAAKKAEEVVLSRGPLSNGRAQRSVAAVWMVQKQFEKWDEILNGDGPSEVGHQYLDGMWHYVTGSALAATGKLDEAREQLSSLQALATTETPDKVLVMVTPPSRVLELASHDLAGRIAQVEGDYASAIESLRAAVEIEDSLGYMEPPDWPNPVRLTLGDALLQSGEAALAEAVYRRDLSWNRNNSWSMEGLCESLEAQDKLAQDEGLCH